MTSRTPTGLDRLPTGIIRDAVDRGELPADTAVDAITDRALSHGLLAAAAGPRFAPTRAGDTPKAVVAQP